MAAAGPEQGWQPPSESLPNPQGWPNSQAPPYPQGPPNPQAPPNPQGPPNPHYGWPPAAPASPPSRRGRRLALLTSALLLLLLAVVAVPLVLHGAGDDKRGAAGTSPTPSNAERSPAVLELSPEAYQLALTSLDSAFSESLGKIAAARTPATVVNAADALATVAGDEMVKLRGMSPPKQVQAAHSMLVSALDSLRRTLPAAPFDDICSGSAATSLISREGAISEVRAAAQELSTADPTHQYKVATWLPKVAKETNRQLGNGKYLTRSMTGGSGQLRIKNSGAHDAVISLMPEKASKPVIVVYVRGKQSFTVSGIKAGNYSVYVSTGTDWDAVAHTFSRNCDFGRFLDAFKFTNTSTTYTIWEITLGAGAGNTNGMPVSPDDFPIG